VPETAYRRATTHSGKRGLPPGVPLERISRLVGHSDTTTTETVYRHQIRPVVQGGAEIMDEIFPGESAENDGPGSDAQLLS
jgi:integrase